MSTYLLPYTQGTISLENGSKVVTGSGTAFLINAKIGDLLQLDDGIMRAIGVAPTSNTAFELLEEYEGSTASGLAYKIHRVSPGWGDASNFNARFAEIATALQTGYAMRSITAVEIGAGEAEFTVPSGMPILPGIALLIASAADPETHWMAGKVTGYEGQTLTVNVTSVGPEGDGVTRADWNINIAGSAGPQGAEGRGAGLRMNWSTGTTGDPGAGKVGVNNAALASATQIRLSETDALGSSIAAILATWDDSTTTAARGYITLKKYGSSAFAQYLITSAITDSGTYDSFTVSHVASAGSFSDNDELSVEFSRTGNTGATGQAGTNAGLRFTFSTTTSMADPGTGNLRANNATLASATALAIDAQCAESGNPSAASLILSWDDGTTPSDRGTLTITQLTAPQNFATYTITGTITDNTGWMQIPVAYVAGNGTIANATTVVVSFARTGNKGADGAGTGDVVGPSSSTDGHLAVFDGGTGKLLKDAAGKLGGDLDINGHVIGGTGAISNAVASGTPASHTQTEDTASAEVLALSHLRATPAGSDSVRIGVYLNDSAGNKTEFVRIRATGWVVTNGSETGRVFFGLANGSGVITEYFGMALAAFYPVANATTNLGGTANYWNVAYVTSIDLGSSSDTRLTRSAAGKLDVEGHTVLTDDQENQGPLAGGVSVTPKNGGTISSGTVTIDCADRPMHVYTNGGAHTLTTDTNVGWTMLKIENGGSAGAITTSSFDKVMGDAFDTTNGSIFRCLIEYWGASRRWLTVEKVN